MLMLYKPKSTHQKYFLTFNFSKQNRVVLCSSMYFSALSCVLRIPAIAYCLIVSP